MLELFYVFAEKIKNVNCSNNFNGIFVVVINSSGFVGRVIFIVCVWMDKDKM